MRDHDFIKEEFIMRHLSIDDHEYLDKYINFLIEYKLDDDQIYSEKHHILPRCTFPNYENEPWNIVEIDYESHRLVHLWLFKSINDRKYQRPLNFMMKEYKNSLETSKAAKRGWVKLKSDEDKYNKWKESKSEYMRSLSIEEQKRRANIFWSNLSDSEYLEFCDKMKRCWTDEKRNQKSIEMKKFYTSEENREKKRRESILIWKDRDEDFRANFRNKMEEINKDEDKRKDASEKIKLLWKSESYLNKMKKRKLRGGVKLKLIHIGGEEIIIESMRKFKETYDFSEYLIRKYRNTNKFISIEDLKESNIELKNYKIETING